MQRLLTLLAAITLALPLGCNNNESRPGGPGATTEPRTNSSTGRQTAHKEATFTLKGPSGSATTLKQGETKEIELTLDRGKDFKQAVKLTFEAPGGVTITPATETVKASDPETVKLRVSAAKEAAVGQHRVTVTGKPETGLPTSLEFEVNVKKS